MKLSTKKKVVKKEEFNAQLNTTIEGDFKQTCQRLLKANNQLERNLIFVSSNARAFTAPYKLVLISKDSSNKITVIVYFQKLESLKNLQT